MDRPESGLTIKDAAWAVMGAAYQKASGNAKYPANARQIMYADRSGFSIFGTLGTDNRRYRFENQINLIDIGLRLTAVEALGLEAEPVDADISLNEWRKRMATLQRHGATDEEIAFLRSHRVELNAMTAPEFISYLEGKLEEHGVEKFLPDGDAIEEHARRIVEQIGTEKALEGMMEEIREEAQTVPLPEDLAERVQRTLIGDPEMSWDGAVSQVIR
jgi:hypothetical protein